MPSQHEPLAATREQSATGCTPTSPRLPPRPQCTPAPPRGIGPLATELAGNRAPSRDSFTYNVFSSFCRFAGSRPIHRTEEHRCGRQRRIGHRPLAVRLAAPVLGFDREFPGTQLTVLRVRVAGAAASRIIRTATPRAARAESRPRAADREEEHRDVERVVAPLISDKTALSRLIGRREIALNREVDP